MERCCICKVQGGWVCAIFLCSLPPPPAAGATAATCISTRRCCPACEACGVQQPIFQLRNAAASQQLPIHVHPASPAAVALLAASAAAQPAAPSNGAAPVANGTGATNGSSGGGGGAKGPWTEISSSIVLAVPSDYLLDGSGRSKCMDMVDR